MTENTDIKYLVQLEKNDEVLNENENFSDNALTQNFAEKFVIETCALATNDPDSEHSSADSHLDADDETNSEKEQLTSDSESDNESAAFQENKPVSPLTALNFPPPPPVEEVENTPVEDQSQIKFDFQSALVSELTSMVELIVGRAMREAVLIEKIVASALSEAISVVTEKQRIQLTSINKDEESGKGGDNLVEVLSSNISNENDRNIGSNDACTEQNLPVIITTSPSCIEIVVEDDFSKTTNDENVSEPTPENIVSVQSEANVKPTIASAPEQTHPSSPVENVTQSNEEESNEHNQTSPNVNEQVTSKDESHPKPDDVKETQEVNEPEADVQQDESLEKQKDQELLDEQKDQESINIVELPDDQKSLDKQKPKEEGTEVQPLLDKQDLTKKSESPEQLVGDVFLIETPLNVYSEKPQEQKDAQVHEKNNDSGLNSEAVDDKKVLEQKKKGCCVLL